MGYESEITGCQTLSVMIHFSSSSSDTSSVSGDGISTSGISSISSISSCGSTTKRNTESTPAPILLLVK